MTGRNTLLGSYLKVERAKYHIQQIAKHADSLPAWWYDIGWIRAIGLPCSYSYAKPSEDPRSNIVELAFIPRRPIAEFIAIMIGDSVHNLRSALDYATTAVVRSAVEDTDRVTFPFQKEKDHLIATKRCIGLMQLQKAIPNLDFVKFFQDVIRPYEDGNSDLWMLSKLDNDDKHNFILPTVAIGNIFQGFMIVDGPGPMGIRLNSSASNDASQPFAFVRLDAANGIPVHSEVKMTANIRFPTGHFFAQEEVVCVLEKLCSIVTETLKSFENFVALSGLDISPGVWMDKHGSLDSEDNS